MRLSEALAETVTARHRRRRKGVRRITVDLDPTVDPTHGGQQLTFFDGFHDTSCYLPLGGFLTFDDEVEQCLFCCVLRSGKAAAKHGCIGVLKRLLPRLRRAFPQARLRIRLDGGIPARSCSRFSRRRDWSAWWAWRRTRRWSALPNR